MTPLAPAARPMTPEDRKFIEADERGRKHDRRCLDIIENELPAIRRELAEKALFGEGDR